MTIKIILKEIVNNVGNTLIHVIFQEVDEKLDFMYVHQAISLA